MEDQSLNGQLSDIFFPELVLVARKKRLTGLLRLKFDTVLKAVFFEAGLPVFAISNLKNEQLEQFLVSTGEVTERVLGHPGVEHGKRFAASLEEKGLLTKAQITRFVNDLVLNIIYSLFEWESGQYSFDEKMRADHEIKLKIAPGDLILEGLRRIKSVEYFYRALSNGEAKLSPPATQEAIYQGLNLNQTEAYVFSRVDQPIAANDLVRITGLAELETLRAAYALYAAGMINLTRVDVKKNGKSATRNDTEKDKEKDELAKLKSEVARAMHVFQAEDFYEVLGVSRGADQNEIKRSYYALAKKFHPDRSHTLGDQPLREKMEKIFQKISEAYETLANEDTRRSYNDRMGISSTISNSTGPMRTTNVSPPPYQPPPRQTGPTNPPTSSIRSTPTGPSTPNANSERKNPYQTSPLTPPTTSSASSSRTPFQSNTPGSGIGATTQPLGPLPTNAGPISNHVASKPEVIPVTTVSANKPISNPIDRAELLAKRAAEAFGKGDLLGAVEMLRQVVTLNPDDVTSRFQLIKILMKNQKWAKEVEQHYLMLIQREPYNEKYHHMLGNYYKQTGQMAKSQATFKNLLQLNPNHSAAIRELQSEDEKAKANQAKSILNADVSTVFSKLFKR